MNANSSAFVPTTARKVTLKSPDGTEIKLDPRHTPTQSASNIALPPQGSPYRQGSPGTPNRRPVSIRLESAEQKQKRIAEEEEKEKEKARIKAEAEEKVRKAKEEEQRKLKEEEARKKKLEEEEKDRLRKEEEDRLRALKEEEEKRLKLEREEKERLRKEEEERIRKLEEEEKARIRLAEEAAKELERQEQLKREEEENERLRLEEEEAAKLKAISPPPPPEPALEELKEDGELRDSPIVSTPSTTGIPSTPKDDLKEKTKEALRINTGSATFVEPLRRRPGPLDLSNTKSVLSPSLPSALATARHIDDLGRIPYPEGILSPKPELNTNAKDGKFRFVTLLFPFV